MPHRPSFSVTLWLRADGGSAAYGAVAADKEWDGGQVVDFLSRQNSGRSLDSGLRPGWALSLQPDGAWSWNLGDGERRLDYIPTARRQTVADGRWHQLAFTVDADANEARLYRDGACVALCSLAGLGDWADAGTPQAGDGAAVEGLRLSDGVLPADAIARDWQGRGNPPPADAPVASGRLKVLAWNIWNGGREDGIEDGVRRTAETIAASGADLVAMQETYGSGPKIADALGFYWYGRSSNLSILSRFPIERTHDVWNDPFRLGGVTLDLGRGRRLRLFTLWIHYLPDFCNDVQEKGMTEERLLAAEEETRGAEIRGIIEALAPFIAESDTTPLVVAGDFNSPSHLDWTAATRDRHCGLKVAWPVSARMQEAGFADAYRRAHPDPALQPGRTWTPRSPQSWQDRIDYVYYRGPLRCAAANVLDEHPEGWPSDHAGVLATLDLQEE